jgi:hypothetical protein
MAVQTLSTADAILKDLYVGPVIEQLNYKTYMLDQIERDSDHVDFTGRRAIVPVHASRNRGRASITDGGNLPVPGKQGWLDAIVGIKYHAYGMSISDQAVRQADGANDGAFVNLLDEETKGLAKDMRKDMNRQIFGSQNGLLASVASGTSSTVVVTDSVQYLGVGDPIDVLVRATGAVGAAGVASATITAIVPSTKTVTFSPAAAGTPDNTYGIYLAGSYGNEMEGLRFMIGTGRTLHGINSATAGNEFWNSTVKAAGGLAGESLFEQVADEIGAAGQGEVDTFLTTRGIRRRLADTFQSQKRYNDAQATKIHGGYTAIFVNEIPVIADDDVPKGYVFAINNDAFKWFEVAKPDWLKSKDGVVFHLGTSSGGSGRKAQWDAWFVWYAALGLTAPNRVGVITGATDD